MEGRIDEAPTTNINAFKTGRKGTIDFPLTLAKGFRISEEYFRRHAYENVGTLMLLLSQV